MAQIPLMPKATAVWLVENTTLTFDQIANFCNLHSLEIKGIADGDVAQGIRGMDPIMGGQITRSELELAQKDKNHVIILNKSDVKLPEIKKKRQPKYMPLSRRQDRPTAIAWLVRNHPELKDSEIIKLVGTTKSTINAIRERSHWNISNIQPQDPVALSLCSQIELDNAVVKAAKRLEKETGISPDINTLKPTDVTVDYYIKKETAINNTESLTIDDVFSNNNDDKAE
ncbi:MAG: DUF1013 domain-containing protein [Rhodobiaceae bacterium]|jgi:hypothetical protein|nr:DUF1013 domain-containing protein [Rhodobiaceae bacterium]MBT5640493.1 DUF1013 domain-containing protein [Rhodobiaceae bacterium]MBT6222512.1 DUF1013 domain-containing protein [Rhodobiaceae bacterium]|tara:strand:- start:470 stop:1153 length:684 start_codon:yes stop_codon:yes gene_type:complete